MSTYQEPPLSVLVLDYRKETETRLCLESIKRHLKVPHEVVLLDNGGVEDYAWSLYKQGLCDVIISKHNGQGGGVGQTDLFRWCKTPLALFVQNDQVLQYDIDDKVLAYLVGLLDSGYHCIDLNGDQSNRGAWTDRAHLIKTSFFNSLAPFPNGGPGPLHHLRWNENYLQEVFEAHQYKIAHVKPAFFRDNGMWSVRELPHPCNGQSRHRTDTKQLWWDKLPEAPYVFPVLSEEEWAKSIAGRWVDGDIPENDKKHSFRCWD